MPRAFLRLALFALFSACASGPRPAQPSAAGAPDPGPARPALTEHLFAWPDLTGSVLAASDPTTSIDDGAQIIRIPLGGGDPIDCSVHRARITAATRIGDIVEALRRDVAVKSVGPLAVLIVHAPQGESPALFANITYGDEGAPGEFKVAVLSRDGLSLVCTHDEPGQREAFARVVMTLFTSVRDPAAPPAAKLDFHEVQVWRKGTQVVGLAERTIAVQPDGGSYFVEDQALLGPRGDEAVDSFSSVWCDPSGRLTGGAYSIQARRRVEAHVALKDGALHLEGAEDGKAFQSTLPSETRCQPLRLPPGQLLPSAEVRVTGYFPTGDPRAARELIYRRSAAGAVTVETDGSRADVEADAQGYLKKLSYGEVTLERLWSK